MPLHNFIVVDPDEFDPDDGVDAEGIALFDDFVDAFQGRHVQLEVFVRPGFDGETTRDTGARGEPFPMTSLHYVADRAAAKAALAAYHTLVDGNPYEFYQHGQSWGYYKVLRVVAASPPILCASVLGTVLQELATPITPTVLQVVQWLLVSTPSPLEEP